MIIMIVIIVIIIIMIVLTVLETHELDAETIDATLGSWPASGNANVVSGENKK